MSGMSPPTALVVARYRAFAGEETLPLRPLTLLFGRNNSGKSALSRALAILGASVDENASSALVVPPDIERNGTFTDLAWQGDAGDYSFELGLRWGDGELREVRYTLDGGSSRPTYVKELVLKDESGNVMWAGVAPPAGPMRQQGEHLHGEVRFTGLVPRSPELAPLRALAARMVALRNNVSWLDGVRKRPQREVSRTGTPPSHLYADGSNASEFLVERPDLVMNTKRYYADLNPPRELEVLEVLDTRHRLMLNPKDRSAFRIDLVDTGEGMIQVLPVLVAASLAHERGSERLLAIEEPESHLHSDAQASLARYMCAIAAGDSPPTIVIETHSRVFLLQVQLAVAEKTLSADRVSVAWIDQDAFGRSSITPVELTASGHPRSGWPPNALADDLKIAAQLARLDLGA